MAKGPFSASHVCSEYIYQPPNLWEITAVATQEGGVLPPLLPQLTLTVQSQTLVMCSPGMDCVCVFWGRPQKLLFGTHYFPAGLCVENPISAAQTVLHAGNLHALLLPVGCRLEFQKGSVNWKGRGRGLLIRIHVTCSFTAI